MGQDIRRFSIYVAILTLSILIAGCGVLVNSRYIEVRAQPGKASYDPPSNCSLARSKVKIEIDGDGYVQVYSNHSDLYIDFYFKDGTDFQLLGNELTPIGKWPLPVGRHLEIEKFSEIWPPSTAFHVHNSSGSTYYTKVTGLPLLEEGEPNNSEPQHIIFEAKMPEMRVNGKLIKLPTLSFSPRNITYFKLPCLK